MKSVVKFFLYLGLISLILYTSGCLNRSGGPQEEAQNAITLERNAPPPAFEETIPTLTDYVEKTTVALYFSDGKGGLAAEQREIPKVVGIARETMHQLCAGPESGTLEPTLPAGTALLDIDIRDGLCTADFNSELINGHTGGSESEYLTVYSIVNTLTQFGTVENVQIKVDGKVTDTIAGHVDVAAPLFRDDNIIKAL